MSGFPFRQQLDQFDCGPTCLLMVAEYYGRSIPRAELRRLCSVEKDGVSLLGISKAAEGIGMRSMAVRLSLQRLRSDVLLPAIIHWEGNHFVVVYRIGKRKVWLADPEQGIVVCSHEEFLEKWTADQNEGHVLVLEPQADFFQRQRPSENRRGWRFLLPYLSPHRRLIAQVCIGLTFGLLLQLVFPFLTQAMVDYGIGDRNLSFVYLFLIAQLVVSMSQTAEKVIRNWIFLHIGARVSISLVADFLQKLMRLPLAFFETRTPGDILQRVEDHTRVERFLTSNSIGVVFSMLSFVVFAIILGLYQWQLLLVFLLVTACSIGWIWLFLKRRRRYDGEEFTVDSQEQDCLVEMIHGASEIKVQGLEKSQRWSWESVAARGFRIDVKQLTLTQTQQIGSFLLDKLRFLILSFLSAKAVIEDEMTLGMMLATQYIVGQMTGPIDELLDFIYQAQDATISLERMEQIYEEEDESEPEDASITDFVSSDLLLEKVSFAYPGAVSSPVLQDLSLRIPERKVTAIVGASGCGKTTLIKLLLQLYPLSGGHIQVGEVPLNEIDKTAWRSRCGAVMQEGYIFSDTIEKNIATGDLAVDEAKIAAALAVASLGEFVEGLPDGLQTKIGREGRELSGGQTQRILIARAIYKDPDYVFFDEATAALDAASERSIMRQLPAFFQNRTVVVIAHRLSTVKNADKIVVLESGRVAEEGTHAELLQTRGNYYRLVENQLQLEQME